MGWSRVWPGNISAFPIIHLSSFLSRKCVWNPRFLFLDLSPDFPYFLSPLFLFNIYLALLVYQALDWVLRKNRCVSGGFFPHKGIGVGNTVWRVMGPAIRMQDERIGSGAHRAWKGSINQVKLEKPKAAWCAKNGPLLSYKWLFISDNSTEFLALILNYILLAILASAGCQGRIHSWRMYNWEWMPFLPCSRNVWKVLKDDYWNLIFPALERIQWYSEYCKRPVSVTKTDFPCWKETKEDFCLKVHFLLGKVREGRLWEAGHYLVADLSCHMEYWFQNSKSWVCHISNHLILTSNLTFLSISLHICKMELPTHSCCEDETK